MRRLTSVIAIVVALLAAVPQVEAKAKTKPKAKKNDKKLFQIFGGFFGKFGQKSTTKIKVVSGPTDVKMRNGRVPGKRWIATCGEFRFKLTIQEKTGVKLEELVKRLEKLPMPYIKACEVVSDETEDGIAVYANLGGAAAHGGKSYINIVPRAGALVIAHEAGHTLEQAARESDAKILDKWGEAIKADKISVSNYGDRVRHEDVGEFAKVYAVCLDAGPEHLARLKKLSPSRFALWEVMLNTPTPGKPVTEPLWAGAAPGSKGVKDNEKVTDRGRGKGHRDRSIANVHKPTITIYLPPKNKATGTAVVICPGGGYGCCVVDKEGHDIARWLKSIGVAGIVLKYRLPRPQGHVYGHKVPLMDAQRAIRTVRHRAAKWNIKPDRIGIMGFSAGGHLASTAGTHFDGDRKSTNAKDPIDRQSCRPDFMILIYPVVSLSDAVGHSGSRRNLLGDKPDPKLVKYYSNELQVTAKTPPTFLISTSDDFVKPENSVNFYLALRKAKVPAEIHVYDRGGHGYGLRKTGDPVAGWPQRCQDWMKARGFLKASK